MKRNSVDDSSDKNHQSSLFYHREHFWSVYYQICSFSKYVAFGYTGVKVSSSTEYSLVMSHRVEIYLLAYSHPTFNFKSVGISLGKQLVMVYLVQCYWTFPRKRGITVPLHLTPQTLLPLSLPLPLPLPLCASLVPEAKEQAFSLAQTVDS